MFRPNGCSFWPDGEYGSCCDNHDYAYHQGGDWTNRLYADVELYKCCVKKTGFVNAMIIYLGVRLFGGIIWQIKKRRNK